MHSYLEGFSPWCWGVDGCGVVKTMYYSTRTNTHNSPPPHHTHKHSLNSLTVLFLTFFVDVRVNLRVEGWSKLLFLWRFGRLLWARAGGGASSREGS